MMTVWFVILKNVDSMVSYTNDDDSMISYTQE